MRTVATVGLAALLLAAAASSAQAQAVHIDDTFCVLLNANGQLVESSAGRIVINNSPNGGSSTSCTAKLPNPTGGTIFWNFANTGILCGLDPCGTTDQWQETISSSGNAKLSCKCN